MRVLLIGATGNLGSRMIPALLAHDHAVVAYVRSAGKLKSLLRSSIHEQITMVEGDATSTPTIKKAILDNNCEAVINTAGAAALAPWSHSDLPKIFRAVVDGIQQAAEQKTAPLRFWCMGGLAILQIPGKKSTFSNYIPIFLEHREDLELLRHTDKDLVQWSMLCPSQMVPRQSKPATKLAAKVGSPPGWQISWVRHIPLVGTWFEVVMNAGQYTTTLEDNAELIAQDLEDTRSPWVGQTVGVIDASKVKA